MKAEQLTIQVFHNPNKRNPKVLEHFNNNWVYDEVETVDEVTGKTYLKTTGISPKLKDIKVQIIETKAGELIRVVDKRDKKLLQLEGSKALQLEVLSSMLIGELKRK